jgi:hypothetical protein
MADLRTEAGVELAGDALFVYVDRLGLDPAMIRPYAAAAAVMDTLAGRRARRRAVREVRGG